MPEPDFSLHLYTPVIDGDPSPIMPLNNIAFGWSRSIRLNGGFWEGSFTVKGNPQDLLEWAEYLGYHLEETSQGAITWEGMIYEVEINVGNVPRRISLEAMSNKNRAQFEQQRTAWATLDASITRYGEKQELIDIPAADEAAAESLRDTYLARYGWPRLVPFRSTGRPQEPHAVVTVLGYAYTMNWKFATITDSTQTLSEFVTDVMTDVDFVTAARIDTNALDAVIESDIDNEDHTPTRCWDLISREILPFGDSSQNIWRFYVDQRRRAYYHQLDMTPVFHMNGGDVRYASGEALSVSPFWITPGVFRDLDFPLTGPESESIYDDIRDFIVDEVVVSANGGYSLRTSDYDSDDFLNALDTFVNLGGGGGGGGGDGDNKWNWPDMSPAQQAWWIGGRIGPPPP